MRNRIGKRSGSFQLPTDEAVQTLEDIGRMEAALAAEIARLRATTWGLNLKGGQVKLAGKPVWWWRAMLVEWASSQAKHQAHPSDLLRGFSDAVKDFGDEQVVEFLEGIEQGVQLSA
jgi:hypothetical protein